MPLLERLVVGTHDVCSILGHTVHEAMPAVPENSIVSMLGGDMARLYSCHVHRAKPQSQGPRRVLWLPDVVHRPPANNLFDYLLVALSLLLAMCLVWAWVLLSVRCALSERPISD